MVLRRLRADLARLATVHPATDTHTSCADTSVAYYVRPDPELKVRLWRDYLMVRRNSESLLHRSSQHSQTEIRVYQVWSILYVILGVRL